MEAYRASERARVEREDAAGDERERLRRLVEETGGAIGDVRDALPGLEDAARGDSTPAEMHAANRYADLLAAAGDDPVRRRAAYEAVYGAPETRFAASGVAAHPSTDPRASGGAAALADAGVSLDPETDAFLEAAAASDPAVASELAASGWRPRRVAAPAAPPVPPGEAMVDLMADRPRDAAPLFEERAATGLDRDLALNERRRVLEARRAEAAAAGYADERDALAGAEAARAENEATRRDAMGAARQRYRSAIDRANALTLDPEGWYHDRGVIGTLGAAIAIGLGSLGSSITGGENSALQIITSSIDRDLEAQRQAIDSAYRGADAEAGILDMLSQEFDSRGAAASAARAAMLEDVARRVAIQGEALAGTEAGIRAEELRLELMRQAAESARAAEAAAFDDELARRRALAETVSAEATAMRDARRAAGGGGRSYTTPTDALLSTANRLIDSGNSPEEAAAATGLDPALIGGSGRFAETSTGDSAAASSRLSTAVGAVERIIAENPDDVPGVGLFDGPIAGLTPRGRAMRQRLDALVNMYGRVHSGGAITADEQELFRSILFGHGTEDELRTGLSIIRGEIGSSETRDREGRSMGAVLDDATSALGGTVIE